MPRSLTVPFNRGWIRRQGRRGARGGMLKARNMRFLPGDPMRVWSVLGRSRYSPSEIPEGAGGNGLSKSVFGAQYDTAPGVLVVHKGNSIYEGDLRSGGNLSKVQTLTESDSQVASRGRPSAYRQIEQGATRWYYPIGSSGEVDKNRFWARTPTGWVRAGHLEPTTGFAAGPFGAGSMESSTEIEYTYRIYDSATDTESVRYQTRVTVPAFSGAAAVRLSWPSGIKLSDFGGTHVRIYRSLLDEQAGIFYRVDPLMPQFDGDGIPLPFVVPPGAPGFEVADNATNTEAQISGTVRADGQEGTVAWAEHGGQPPKAGGCIVFQDHMVMFDLPDRPNDIIYSAKGYPEAFPFTSSNKYAYFLRLQSDKADRILTCARASQYLLVFCDESIFRVSYLQSLDEPGFSNEIQDIVTDDHGVCGRFAADSFGVGPDQALRTIYVSRQHGLMLTDGVGCEEIVKPADFLSLVNTSRMGEIEVRNYPSMEEVWVFFTPKGGTANTQAIIVDYSHLGSMGLRVTGPIDVRALASDYTTDNDGQPRFYILDDDFVYVADNGEIDAQRNYNPAGEVQYEIETARYHPGSSRSMSMVHRGSVFGFSRQNRPLSIEHRSFDGSMEHVVLDDILMSSGEFARVFAVESSGIEFSETLRHTGQPGNSYDEDDESAVTGFAVEVIDYELSRLGEIEYVDG